MAKSETPLMGQYNKIKAQNPDAILLFRVGDFYEMFGRDAIIASQVLGIVQSNRNNGSSQTELAGFPHHALETYLPKLVKAGHRVAVCDQLEKPSPLKKLVKRGVTELVTPGVTFSDQLLEQSQNNYLCALYPDKKIDKYGLALLDVSTGEFLLNQGSNKEIEQLLHHFQPAEILYPKGQKQELASLLGGQYYLYGLEDWIFKSDYTLELLLKQYQVQSLKGFGVESYELGQIAAGAALHYALQTRSEAKGLSHLRPLNRIQTERYVWLDRFTVRNLELITGNQAESKSLFNVLDKTCSPMGSRLLKKWILLPLKDLEPIKKRQIAVAYFVENEEFRDQIRDQIRQIGDLERLIAKVPSAKLQPRELQQLGKALRILGEIQPQLLQTPNPSLQQLGERIQACSLIRERIEKSLLAELPAKLDKGQVIAAGICPELDENRNLVANSQQILQNLVEQERERSGVDNLKIGSNNVFGYYFEVTNKHKNRFTVPENWTRKQTLTNAERYISPELKTLEEKILSADETIAQLEYRAYMDLLLAINEFVPVIQQNAQWIGQLDCLQSLALQASLAQYCQPQLNNSLIINIKQGRHPVIEQQLKIGETYVANDLKLDSDEEQILMITGPNMSGKSALLRQTALICLMAQIGSFVPAAQAELGLIDRIFTRVGASDNLASGESTFMVEMNETASILNNLSARSLILLDEIGRGTSTYDGISIAWSIAEYLHEQPDKLRPKTLFATHYHELNELAKRYERIRNFHVSTKEVNKKIIFLRQLKAGGSEHSFGIHVARLAGMPPLLVQRAEIILQDLEEKRSSQGQNKIPTDQIPPLERLQLQVFEQEKSPAIWTEVKDKLLQLDLYRLSPIECMMELENLIRKIKQTENV